MPSLAPPMLVSSLMVVTGLASIGCLILLSKQSILFRYGVVYALIVRRLAKRQTRFNRTIRFQRLASQVIADAHGLLGNAERNHEARAFLPVVTDVRKYCQCLVSRRHFYHRYLAPRMERNLERILRELIFLEHALRALPRPGMSIDEVLATNSPCCRGQKEDCDHASHQNPHP